MQRKRHINFKDKELNSSSSGRLSSMLHSIPTLLLHNRSSDKQMKNKSNVLYSIPCVKSCACTFCKVGDKAINTKLVNWRPQIKYTARIISALLLLGMSLAQSGEVLAVACSPVISATDSSTITPLPGGTTTPATASLSLSNPNMTSSAITPGNTTTVSTNVTVNVGNAESYSLTLKVDSTTLSNGNTTINAGNVTTDNTWGYKWDNATSYSAPTTTGTNLTVPALTNNSVNFTKNLTFGAKFGANAEAGHYKGSGTLSLVATPKATTYTLADLTQMQQLSLAPEACANTPYLSGLNYSAEYTLTDVRDNSTYTVRKLGDGKCWMTQNLKLSAPSVGCTQGRTLNTATSDIAEEYYMAASSISGFSDNAASNSYYDSGTNTGYYTWCAATAGTCTSANSSGQEAPSSICPKGWKLPTGGTGTSTDFWKLFRNMGLTISNDNLASTANGSTNWGTGDLAKVQGPPCNLTYTGYVYNGSLTNTTYGYWWSRTANDSNLAYNLSINSSYVYPGTRKGNRYVGNAVRCVAQDSTSSGGQTSSPK